MPRTPSRRDFGRCRRHRRRPRQPLPGAGRTAGRASGADEALQVGVRLGPEFRSPDGGAWPIATDLEMRLWFAAITAGAPTPTGSHDKLRWLTARQLDDVAWLPADLAIIDRLRPHLAGPPSRTA